MKIVASIGFLLALILVWLIYGSAQAERRARFLQMKNELMEAHLEIQKYGSFTNYFRTTKIYRFTNHLFIGDMPYHPEFAAENDEFRSKGFLSITTNELFVWVDKKRGPKLMNRPSEFPAGL